MEAKVEAMDNQEVTENVGAGTAQAASGAEQGGSPAGSGTDPRGRQLSPELKEKYLRNPLVKSINDVGDITYTHSFYIEMYGHIHYGNKTYEQAYEALGFSVAELGVNRALSAGKRAVRMGEDGTLYNVSPGKFNGTIPYDQMKLEGMSLPEQVAQLSARVRYLECYNNEQKKTFSWLDMRR